MFGGCFSCNMIFLGTIKGTSFKSVHCLFLFCGVCIMTVLILENGDNQEKELTQKGRRSLKMKTTEEMKMTSKMKMTGKI